MKVNIGCFPKNDNQREIEIHVDDWDIWSVDHTLALIIHPVLLKLKEVKTGIPYTYNEDVPKALRSKDQHSEARWNYILDEMIFAFDQLITDGSEWDWSWGNNKELNERVLNGFVLFGKYFTSLWT